MSRFDLHRGSNYIDYYITVQSEFHDALKTRVVIPVLARSKVANFNRGLHVPLFINDHAYYAVTPMMAAVPTRQLGKPIGTVLDQATDITAAIDFLLQGF